MRLGGAVEEGGPPRKGSGQSDLGLSHHRLSRLCLGQYARALQGDEGAGI